MDAVVTKKDDIKEIVHRASVVIAHYWPMTGFVHHNPIRGLEIHPFKEAVKLGERFVKGRGFLTNEQYRDLLTAGRIDTKHLENAISSRAKDEHLEIAGKKISNLEVIRTHLLLGITAPSNDTIEALVDNEPSVGTEILSLMQSSSENKPLQITDKSSHSTSIREIAKLLEPKVEQENEASKIGKDVTFLTWCDNNFHKELTWLVDRELIKWCGAFLDEGHGTWAMPDRDKGFYALWKSLASQEWSPCGISDSASKIKALPDSPEEALVHLLDNLGIPEDLRQDYLSHELTALCGWASFINWRAEHTEHPWQEAFPIDLVQYLAVRLFYVREVAGQCIKEELDIDCNVDSLVKYFGKNQKEDSSQKEELAKLSSAWRLTTLANSLGIASAELAKVEPDQLQSLLNWLDEFPESEHGMVWLEAHEAGYQDDLTEKLRNAVSKNAEKKEEKVRPLAQAMFCIDVRSEVFRRKLEEVGNYETIGFAGFFAIPMEAQALDQHHKTLQLPAIVSPKYLVHEVPRENVELERHNAGHRFKHTIFEILHDIKFHILTPFVMVESLGWLFGVQLFGRTMFPQTYRNCRKVAYKAIVPPIGTEMTSNRTEDGLGLTDEEQCAQIETALKTMGLVDNFARLIVVAGHTSTSDNNPYEAALNCGACGGNSGKPNARLFAAMANKPFVREHLAKNGIDVPKDTHFIGAVHDTTTDAVDLYDLEDLPDSHRDDWKQLKKDLKEAAKKTNHERCLKLPSTPDNPSEKQVADEIGRRAGDWSETRPEWGLAGNAAFIIANRTLTKEINLEGRSFLNSHDYRVDTTGNLLEGIMLGPMVVGQWINAEHYFSATDTEVYGSGSKVYHNVVSNIGIMSGPQSDLRTGLAWQSMMDGEKVYHEPLRLFVVIEAPRDRIQEIVDRQPEIKQIMDNEWIHMLAIEHDSEEKLFRYHANEGWKPA